MCSIKNKLTFYIENCSNWRRFQIFISSLEALKKGEKVDIFCGEKELGVTWGVNIFGYDLDLEPQYLDNFNDEDRKLIEQFGDDAELTDLLFHTQLY